MNDSGCDPDTMTFAEKHRELQELGNAWKVLYLDGWIARVPGFDIDKSMEVVRNRALALYTSMTATEQRLSLTLSPRGPQSASKPL